MIIFEDRPLTRREAWCCALGGILLAAGLYALALFALAVHR